MTVDLLKERKREWTEIRIRFNDGSDVQLMRMTLDEIKKALPVLEALQEAKYLKEQLDRFLGNKE